MVLQAQPIFDAVASVMEKQQTKPRIILMCPQGKPFNQAIAEELADEEHLIFICGHYEGYDERIREHLVTDELSIGDYVLTGGELDRKSTRLNSSHVAISYAVFCLKKKN